MEINYRPSTIVILLVLSYTMLDDDISYEKTAIEVRGS